MNSFLVLSDQQKRGLVLLVASILDQLDEISALQRAGHSARLGRELLSEMCSVLRDADEVVQTAYVDVLQTVSATRTPSDFPRSIDLDFQAETRVRQRIDTVRRQLSAA